MGEPAGRAGGTAEADGEESVREVAKAAEAERPAADVAALGQVEGGGAALGRAAYGVPMLGEGRGVGEGGGGDCDGLARERS